MISARSYALGSPSCVLSKMDANDIAMVHETYLKLISEEKRDAGKLENIWQHRVFFFALFEGINIVIHH